MHFEREPPAIYWCFCIALMFRNQCPSPPRHWIWGGGMWSPRSPHSAAHFTLEPHMPGVVTSVKPVFRKPNEPDPRLARLADKIKQIRRAQALRLRRPAVRSEDLH